VADEHSQLFRERAYEHYQHAREEIKRVAAQLQEKDESESEDNRAPLSIEERKEFTILLSWGGPSDGYKIYVDNNNEPVEGYYFFADWFEYEEFKLSGEELESVLAIYPLPTIL
jgi:hypothetical protein